MALQVLGDSSRLGTPVDLLGVTLSFPYHTAPVAHGPVSSRSCLLHSTPPRKVKK